MPIGSALKSKKELRFLMANKPSIGRKLASETNNIKALPDSVGDSSSWANKARRIK